MGKGKIGIFVNCQHGDIALSTCVLKHKDIVWHDKDIIWFCDLFSPRSPTFLDMLKYNDAISEIRDFPPVFFRELIDNNHQFRYDKKLEFESTRDIDIGYFPAPWAALPNPAFENINYAEIPRKIYGADASLSWKPYLGFSNEERKITKDFCFNLPHKKTIMLETQLRSAGDFRLNDDVLKDIIQQCRNKFGQCNFIFADALDHSYLFDDCGMVSGSHFTVRQTALLYNYCTLFIGVSSGISVATCCWGNEPVPRVEIGSRFTLYGYMSNSPTISIIADNLPFEQQMIKLKTGVQDALNNFF